MLTTQNKVIHFMYNSEYIQTEIRNQFDKVMNSTESGWFQTASEMVKHVQADPMRVQSVCDLPILVGFSSHRRIIQTFDLLESNTLV